VLVAVVDHADADGEVTEQAIAESLAVSQSALTESLETLCEFDMVSRTENGYRPTITAHELLEAGIELNETVVLDLVEE
jgi:DNA-binding HxlR family transcriptional regulator